MRLEVELSDGITDPEIISIDVASSRATGEVITKILQELSDPSLDGPPAAYIRHKDWTLAAWTWQIDKDDRKQVMTATWSH